MKAKYLIINQKGKVLEPDSFIESNDCLEQFKIFVQIEALGNRLSVPEDKHRAPVDKPQSQSKSPAYLKYAHKLGFNWEPNGDIGFVQYDYKANLILRLVQEYARQLNYDIGLPLYEVRGANIFDRSHPSVQAYAKLFGDRLFQFKSGKKQVVMSYDASYPQFNLAQKYQLSYKDLPFAHYSISDCYRHEQSGECMLLYRIRRFYMSDIHPYLKSVEEAFNWYPKIENQIVEAADEIGQEYHVLAEIGSEEFWNQYKEKIAAIAVGGQRNLLVKIHRDNKPRYWIANIDYKIIDKLGQSREIACIQIDIGNAKRLGIEYVDKNNHIQHPVIIHSAVPGGIERFIYIMLDNFPESFPLWAHPIQIRLIPVADRFIKFCSNLHEKHADLPVRIDIDDRKESVGKKIAKAKDALIPFAVVIGEREVNAGKSLQLDKAVQKVLQSSRQKPFIKFLWPREVSRQVR